MFNDATSGQGWPQRTSTDNDPLFQYHRWKANIRVLEIEEVKSLPHVPMSHPFVERLIGSVRRELLDQTFTRTRLTWRTSCVPIRLTTMNIDATQVGTAPHQQIPNLEMSLIFVTTTGKNTVAGYFCFRWRLEVGIRQGQVLHWTHHDPQGKEPGGWVEHRGKRDR